MNSGPYFPAFRIFPVSSIYAPLLARKAFFLLLFISSSIFKIDDTVI